MFPYEMYKRGVPPLEKAGLWLICTGKIFTWDFATVLGCHQSLLR